MIDSGRKHCPQEQRTGDQRCARGVVYASLLSLWASQRVEANDRNGGNEQGITEGNSDKAAWITITLWFLEHLSRPKLSLNSTSLSNLSSNYHHVLSAGSAGYDTERGYAADFNSCLLSPPATGQGIGNVSHEASARRLTRLPDDGTLPQLP